MSSRPTFGTVKRVVAILIAITIVLAAGIVVGQAPALFGVDEDPEAAIEFEDQQSNGTAVTIDEVALSDDGFVVITDDGDAAEPVAVSEPLDSGTHENVTVEIDEEADRELLGQLTATVHQDTTDDGTYAYAETDGEEDRPYLSAGYPVSDTATVTAEEVDETLEDSFVVESIETPDSATTNDTIEVAADIRNPTDVSAQQNVELRLDGQLLEWQAFELEGGEASDVVFEVDTRGTHPGEQAIGVHTDRDGAIELIDLEFHTDPDVAIADATETSVTVDVAIPVEGFVAIEDEDGDVIGASDELEPGEHEEIRIPFDENVSVDDDEDLTTVIYEGDPDDRESASPYELDADDGVDVDIDEADEDDEAADEGERVETTFTIADEADDQPTDAE